MAIYREATKEDLNEVKLLYNGEYLSWQEDQGGEIPVNKEITEQNLEDMFDGKKAYHLDITNIDMYEDAPLKPRKCYVAIDADKIVAYTQWKIIGTTAYNEIIIYDTSDVKKYKRACELLLEYTFTELHSLDVVNLKGTMSTRMYSSTDYNWILDYGDTVTDKGNGYYLIENTVANLI